MDRDPKASLDAIFRLAEKHGKPIDIHLHEYGELGAFTLEEIITRTRAHGMQGKVGVSHCFCLGMPDPHRVGPLMDQVAREDIRIFTTGHPSAEVPSRRTSVAASAPFEVAVPTADGKDMVLAPGMRLMLQWTHYFSPEQLNPFDLNPLRDILSAQVDFERLRAHSPVKLFIAATNVNTGKLRLFRAPELTPDAVLASACLPTMHRSVVIDGEPYWDGGYAANPAVFPLFHECSARDILLVMLAPLKHSATPQSAADIKSRMMELAFNATFLREMRMFAHLRERAARSAW